MSESGIELIDLGRLAYEKAWAIQQARVEEVAARRAPDTLYLVEHEPVITLGRGLRGQSTEFTERIRCSVPVIPEIERGGSATYHGPGQLVGYPILRLARTRRGLRGYLCDLEEVLIRALADLGLPDAERREGLTGVWCRGRKLASIGVAVRRWTTWHGFALNCETDLGPLAAFRPCGLDASLYSTASELAGRRITVEEARPAVVQRFREVFERERAPACEGPRSPDS